jgi:hypothetical protein
MCQPESPVPSSLPILDTIGLSYRVFWHALGRFVLLLLLMFLTSFVLAIPIIAAKLGGASKGTVAGIQGIATLAQFLIQVIVQMAAYFISFRILEGRDCTIREAIYQSASRFWAMVGVSLLTTLMVFLGMVLLIVPGLIVALMLAVAVQACLFEGIGIMDSLHRSRELTYGQKWRIFGIGAVLLLTFLLTLIVLGAAGGALLPKTIGPIVTGILTILVMLALIPLGVTLPPVLYAQLRSIYEGHGPIGAAEAA